MIVLAVGTATIARITSKELADTALLPRDR
jgi:hypothetical protein